MHVQPDMQDHDGTDSRKGGMDATAQIFPLATRIH